jgi:spore coat protein U-like protein
MATTQIASLMVTATVAAGCNASTSTAYQSYQAAMAGTGGVSVTCSNPVPYTVSVLSSPAAIKVLTARGLMAPSSTLSRFALASGAMMVVNDAGIMKSGPAAETINSASQSFVLPYANEEVQSPEFAARADVLTLVIAF